MIGFFAVSRIFFKQDQKLSSLVSVSIWRQKKSRVRLHLRHYLIEENQRRFLDLHRGDKNGIWSTWYCFVLASSGTGGCFTGFLLLSEKRRDRTAIMLGFLLGWHGTVQFPWRDNCVRRATFNRQMVMAGHLFQLFQQWCTGTWLRSVDFCDLKGTSDQCWSFVVDYFKMVLLCQCMNQRRRSTSMNENDLGMFLFQLRSLMVVNIWIQWKHRCQSGSIQSGDLLDWSMKSSSELSPSSWSRRRFLPCRRAFFGGSLCSFLDQYANHSFKRRTCLVWWPR